MPASASPSAESLFTPSTVKRKIRKNSVAPQKTGSHLNLGSNAHATLAPSFGSAVDAMKDQQPERRWVDRTSDNEFNAQIG